MSRDLLTAPVRAQLLTIVRQEIARYRAKLDEEYPVGSPGTRVGARNGVDLIYTQSVLLALVGAVCGDEAEREVGKLVEWDGRVPAGPGWLSRARHAATGA